MPRCPRKLQTKAAIRLLAWGTAVLILSGLGTDAREAMAATRTPVPAVNPRRALAFDPFRLVTDTTYLYGNPGTAEPFFLARNPRRNTPPRSTPPRNSPGALTSDGTTDTAVRETSPDRATADGSATPEASSEESTDVDTVEQLSTPQRPPLRTPTRPTWPWW